MIDLQPATVNDWMLWNDREDITLRVQGPVATYSDHLLSATGGAAKRRAINWREMAASTGAYTNQDRNWLIPSANLPVGVIPKPGDVVRDSQSVDWTIGDILVGKFGNTYRCTCRALAIVEQLKDIATIKRVTSAADAAGRPALLTTTDIYSNLACRVQPEDSDMGDVFDRIANPTKFTGYLASPVHVLAHDQFIVRATTYTIIGSRNPARIWDLMAISLELVP